MRSGMRERSGYISILWQAGSGERHAEWVPLSKGRCLFLSHCKEEVELGRKWGKGASACFLSFFPAFSMVERQR